MKLMLLRDRSKSTAYFLRSDKPFFFLVGRQVNQVATIPI